MALAIRAPLPDASPLSAQEVPFCHILLMGPVKEDPGMAVDVRGWGFVAANTRISG